MMTPIEEKKDDKVNIIVSFVFLQGYFVKQFQFLKYQLISKLISIITVLKAFLIIYNLIKGLLLV